MLTHQVLENALQTLFGSQYVKILEFFFINKIIRLFHHPDINKKSETAKSMVFDIIFFLQNGIAVSIFNIFKIDFNLIKICLEVILHVAY